MALPYIDCEIPYDVCCDNIFTAAEVILDAVLPAVNSCVTPSKCGDPIPIVGYVSMGTRIEDPVADYVVVSLANLTKSPGSEDQTGKLHVPVWRAEFQVRLLESGWAMAEEINEEIYVPDPVVTHALARHSYAHGEAMFRAVANLVTSRSASISGSNCQFHTVSALIPLEPSGGATGWQMTVTMNLRFAGQMQEISNG
jgi:hypothetical protein